MNIILDELYVHLQKMTGISSVLLAIGCSVALAEPEMIFTNGYVYTVDASDSVRQAVAIKDGKINYVGTDAEALKLKGATTKIVDLGGKMMMPGLVDAHLHSKLAGQWLSGCSLNYDALTVEEALARIQACLDNDKQAKDDDWLLGAMWFRQAMQPRGADLTAADLDRLKTKRPIAIRSSDAHSLLANSRALALAKVTDTTRNPETGTIARDEAGKATGIFEDGARDVILSALPKRNAEQMAREDKDAVLSALRAMRGQGITSFLEAVSDDAGVAAYRSVAKDGYLTARGHFSLRTDPAQPPDVIVKRLQDQAVLNGEMDRPEPSVSVHTAKMFMDGVIQAPAQTGALVEPYLVNKGTEEKPEWVPGTGKGELYFDEAKATAFLVALAEAGLDMHLHTDGDAAVNTALAAVEAMRARYPGKDLRPAFAHNELILPADYARMKAANVTAVLSLQWGKPAPDTITTVREYIGPERFNFLETGGRFAEAGVRVAIGSDWPVERLDPWYAIQVGVTRENGVSKSEAFQGRLGDDPGLSVAAALRAATIDAAYTLRQENVLGSIEKGKLADLIVIDRNLLDIPPDEISQTKVLTTVVGGKIVYEAK